MDQENTINRQDIAGFDQGLSLLAGPSHERFFQKLVDYFNDWLDANSSAISHGQIPRDRALLVLMSESPNLEPGVPDAIVAGRKLVDPALCLLDDGVAVANEGLSEVFQLVPRFSNGLEEAIEFVDSHISGDQVFAILVFNQARMLVHEAGVPIADWMKAKRIVSVKQLPNVAISPQVIEAQLDEFHNEALSTHRGTIARLMWEIHEEDKKSTLKEKPELHVQSGMLTYFRGIYRHKVAVVDEEIGLTEGRVDVRLVRFDPSNRQLITMIELKVLDPEKSPKYHQWWAHEGIRQAHEYKRTNYTDAAFACIFDARYDQTVQMPSLQPDANESGVILKLHPMAVPPPRPVKVGKGAAAQPADATVVQAPVKKAANASAAKKPGAAKRTRKTA